MNAIKLHYGLPWKHFKIGIYGICACIMILIATLLRLLLISQGWPSTDSDESTMGLMALHIAYRGEHPVFFYGQGYMGSLEAYIAAPLFHLFGPSTFSLRLGLVFIFTLFLISMYLLASLLYTKRLALATLILLCLGSDVILRQEVYAIGGYSETLLFGTAAFLLASWLALSSNQEPSKHSPQWHLIAYGCWGLVVGLGIWSDVLILPFALMAGLLLVVFCWHEWRSWAPLCILLGLVIGTFPFIIYNITAPPRQDTLSYVLKILHEGDHALIHTHTPIIAQIRGAFLISLPTITGITPPCNVTDVKLFGFLHHQTFLCSARYIIWGLGLTILYLLAVVLAVMAIWRLRHRSRANKWTHEERLTFVRQSARLLVLGSAAITMLLFVLSPASAVFPVTSSRYLFGLLIATPAVISPLWNAGSSFKLPSPGLTKGITVFKGVLLLLIGMVFLVGTFRAFSMIPAAQAVNHQQEVLIDDLLHQGIRRMYSDYWTCGRVVFQSREQIICSVIDGQLHVGYNRYTPYSAIVKAYPNAAYVLRTGTSEAKTFAQKVTTTPDQHYQHLTLDGYEIYQPT